MSGVARHRGLAHALQAMRAIVWRELAKFSRQYGRLISALVRPLLWLAVFAAGFRNVFGVAIVEPYDTYIPYDLYIAPGLVGMVLLFNGMQSSLAMVYDREMGLMRLLLTAPLPRAWILLSKLIATAVLSLAWPDGHVESFEGKVEGRLVWPPRGERGFGYDPIFLPEGRSHTFGEMDPAGKHEISHRAVAFRQLIAACFQVSDTI